MSLRAFLALMLVMAALVFSSPVPAAAAEITLAGIGDNAFVLQGAGLTGVAVVDVQIVYDTATLISPRVEQGAIIPGDAIFDFNSSDGGEIRLFVRIRNNALAAATGTIATFRFGSPDGAAGNVLSMSANLVNVMAMPVAARTRIVKWVPPPVSDPKADPEVGSGTTATPGATVGPPAAPTTTASGAVRSPVSGARLPAGLSGDDGGGNLPAGEPEERELLAPSADAPQPPRNERSGERAAADPQPTAPTEKKGSYVIYPTVLERFRTFTGEQTPQALLALFVPPAEQKVRQEPVAAISSGEDTVTLVIDLSGKAKAPNFFLTRARVIGLEQVATGVWELETLPDENTMDARLTVLQDNGMLEFPMVVAPPAATGTTAPARATEADFARFLKERGTARQPRFDLNGDGLRNYIDDYIYAVNYLAGRQPPQAEATSGTAPSGR